MVFSSLVFLWLFLPVVFALYFTAKEQYRNVILLIASLFFYAWGEPVYVLVMILSIIVNCFCGLKIGAAEEHKRKRALFWGVFVNLALLGVFKYTGFFTENVNAIFGLQVEVKHLPLPIGISFYTFQSISYLVDIYRRVCEPQRNIIKMGLFISFFPQLIAGPILKYYDIASQIDKRQVTLPLFNEGAVRFLQGLAKKVIIANIMAKTADEIFALGLNDLSTPAAWIGIIAYTFQIYFDFSGYSDMAIGLGYMLGFKFLENFNYPYIAKTVQDFWRRWHISLSSWFRDYVYIPLGGNRKGNVYVNLFIVFFVTGMWHGASWNFVLWGLWHGIFLVIERIIKNSKLNTIKLPYIITWAYTMVVVIIGWVMFRAVDMTYAYDYIKIMFSFKANEIADNIALFFIKDNLILFIIAIISATPFIKNIYHILNNNSRAYKYNQIVKPLALITIFIIAISYIVNSTYNPFLYFNF